MQKINPEILEKVADEAMTRAGNEGSWQRAITRAKSEILSNPYLHVQEDGSLLVLSSTSQNIYEANGSCQCKAFLNHRACWHRAALRLLKLYKDLVAVFSRESAAPVAAPCEEVISEGEAARASSHVERPIIKARPRGIQTRIRNGRMAEFVGPIRI